MLRISDIVHLTKRCSFRFSFLLIFSVAAALRLKGLTIQSLWQDELGLLYYTKPDLTLGYVIGICRDFENCPPFFNILLWGWQKVFGAGEYTVRLLPAVMGIAGVAAMYFLGKEIFSKETGLLAMAITAATPFHLYYSQEVRSYSLIFLLAVLSFLFLVRIFKKGLARDKILYAASLSGLLWSHYFGIFVCASQIVFFIGVLFLKKKFPSAHRKDAWHGLGLCAACLFLFCLLWSTALLTMIAITDFWVPKPGPYFAINYFHEYWGSFFLLSLVMFFFIGRYFVFDRNARGFAFHKPLLLCWVIISIFIPYARSINHPSLLFPRYTIVVLPALILMAAEGLASIRNKKWRYVIFSSVMVLFLFSVFVAHGNYYKIVKKPQWREAVEFVLEKDPEGSYPIYVIEDNPVGGRRFSFLAHSYQYYFNDIFKRDRKVSPLKIDEIFFLAEQRQIHGFWLLEGEVFIENRAVFLPAGFKINEQLGGCFVVATLFVLEKEI